jgi:D-arabinose 1-dehydrogenase-like Zn-dependent alcohol dehydrogenase
MKFKGCTNRSGLAVGSVPVSVPAMIHYGVSVHGWPSGHAQDSEEAIAFAEHQSVKCMIETFKLEDAQKVRSSSDTGIIAAK